MQPKNNEKSSKPAEKPYSTNQPPPPPNQYVKRIAGENGQWGNLPPRLREDILQQVQLEPIQEYRERLRRYYILLGADE